MEEQHHKINFPKSGSVQGSGGEPHGRVLNPEALFRPAPDAERAGPWEPGAWVLAARPAQLAFQSRGPGRPPALASLWRAHGPQPWGHSGAPACSSAPSARPRRTGPRASAAPAPRARSLQESAVLQAPGAGHASACSGRPRADQEAGAGSGSAVPGFGWGGGRLAGFHPSPSS